MDLTLSRLVRTPGEGACAASGMEGAASVCADQAAFEHLAAELAGAVAPPAPLRAATDGQRGFYVGLSSTATTLRSSSRYWMRGTRGHSYAAEQNDHVDSLSSWHRLEVRKGLPFGVEVGSSLGFGLNTSLWVFSLEAKLALFEGFRTGLGALPDIAVHGVTQRLIGSSQLSLHTQAIDVTLSKPYVWAEHVITPGAALQMLFVDAKSGAIDLTPQSNSFAACAPEPGSPTRCTQSGGTTELADTVTFRELTQTRMRMFVGVTEHFRQLSIALSAGFDLTTQRLPSRDARDGLSDTMLRQFSLHLASGLRY